MNTAQPSIEQRTLYAHENRDFFRIPGMLAPRNGALLAFCQRRKGSMSDHGHESDNLVRRSVDGGRTWSPAAVVAAREGVDIHTGPAVQDARSGRLFKFCRYWPVDNWKTVLSTTPYAALCEQDLIDHVSVSEDDGATWSEPRPMVMPYPVDAVSTGTGNGLHGIQLASGALAIAAGYRRASGVTVSAVLLSGDGGTTWSRGAAFEAAPAIREFVFAQLADGRIYCNFRNNEEGDRRLACCAPAELDRFGEIRKDDHLPEPVAHAGLTAIPPDAQRPHGVLIFSNPNVRNVRGRYSTAARRKMTVRASLDGGLSWPHALEIWRGPASYSDVAVTRDGNGWLVHVLYEQGDDSNEEAHSSKRIVHARLSLETLLASRADDFPADVFGEGGEAEVEPTGLIGEPGPWPGIKAYRGGTAESLPLPSPLGKTGTVMCWLRLDAPILNGPGVARDGGTVLEFPGLAKLNLWWYSGYGGIVWEGAEGQPSLPLEVPGIPGPQWIHLCYTWDAVAGRLDGYINGTPLRLAGSSFAPWSPVAAVDRVRVHAARWTVAGLRVLDRPVTRDEVFAGVPSIYRGALDHTLGAQNLGTLEPEAWCGETRFVNPLDTPETVAGWRMEGTGDVSFQDGWMRLRSLEPEGEGKEGHIVYWCDRDLPADFLLEFDVRILGPRGLNILIFCATGCNGENVLDPSLKPRTGVFGHYTNGDIDCYHISYYAHTPNAAGGRTTSNLRKNYGFYLVDNGPIGIPPASTGVHHVMLLKQGGTIRLGVDGRRVIDWYDDGRHYGPVLGGGMFAFRQMKWTVAEYRNLRVSTLAARRC